MVPQIPPRPGWIERPVVAKAAAGCVAGESRQVGSGYVYVDENSICVGIRLDGVGVEQLVQIDDLEPA